MIIDGVWITPAMYSDIARLTGAHRTTVKRWVDRQKLPVGVAGLLKIVYQGDLSAIHEDWAGWRITRDGLLHRPEYGRPFRAEVLIGIQYRMAELAAVKLELRELRQRLADDPLPEDLERALVAVK